jgi:acetyl-CoA carboxylase carboxyl transferase subunit alpha
MADTDFEAPLRELQKQIDELAKYPGDPAKDREANRLRRDLDRGRREIYSRLTPWQKTLTARHPNRPYLFDYVQALCTEFVELHGDRRFGDDPAIICGFALYKDRPVAVIGHQKGRDTKQKIYRNFGMPKPEGYRKALRVMQLAAKFRRPILTFIDTPGAYPGLDAEERGQAEAIAYNLREMARLSTPIIVNVTGEGGSGGALAIAVGDRVNMLEHSVYSVISPEGCASILWRDPARAEDAATAMKITAADLKGLGIVDEIVPEPAGGAHVDHDALFRTLDVVIESQLKELRAMAPADLVAARYEKFRNMGRLGQDFFEEASYTMPAVTRSTLPDAEAGEAGAEAESETEA